MRAQRQGQIHRPDGTATVRSPGGSQSGVCNSEADLGGGKDRRKAERLGPGWDRTGRSPNLGCSLAVVESGELRVTVLCGAPSGPESRAQEPDEAGPEPALFLPPVWLSASPWASRSLSKNGAPYTQ